MREWQPIETAPKDGSPMMLWHVNWKCPISCVWDRVNGVNNDFPWREITCSNRWPMQSFTHWMPLIDPPKSNAQ